MTTPLTPADIVAKLEQRARNARDNALAELTVRDAFMEEYLLGLSGSPFANKKTHARSMELYDFTIGAKNRAHNFTSDAELFETAAALIALQTEGE